MFNKIIFVLFAIQVSLAAAEIGGTGSLKGKVTDSETRKPLIGVTVVLNNTQLGASTDLDGNYEISGISAGTYSVSLSYIGYAKAIKTDIIIRPGRITMMDAGLKASVYEINNVVVTGGYFSELEEKPVSAVNFSSEEIRRSPGTASDVSRIMFSLPSVAKVNDQRNSLIVRGGSPVENSYYLDNIEIPNINHFPVQGSSDGPIGLLNIYFIKDVNFYTGGFSPVYGDRLSSVMEINFREGNREKFDQQVQLSMAGFGASVEGPIGSSGSYLLSASKSYLDLIMDAAQTGGALPKYGDVQAKVVIDADKQNKFTFLNLLSIDNINMAYEDTKKAEANIYGFYKSYSNVAGINWQNLRAESGFSNTSISHTITSNDGSYFETKSKNHLLRNLSTESQLKLRNINYLKTGKNNSIEFGFEAGYSFSKFDFLYEKWQDSYGNITPEMRVNKDFNNVKTGVFGNLSFQPLDKLKINLGARGDYFSYNKKSVLSPRISASYSLGSDLSINGSTGIFYQNIPNMILTQNESFKDLKIPGARHFVVGITKFLDESIKMSIEAYYKDYFNFPIDQSQPKEFLFDQVMTQGLFLNHSKLADNGKGISKGVELLIQKKLADDFYGLLSASYSKTTYSDYDGIWHNRIYDNKINFTFEGGYIPNNSWEFKVRWTYAGGAPYTPFDIAASVANNKGIIDVNKINSQRLPDYHSLSFRVDKRFYFGNSNLIAYLSVWNAYGRENIAQYQWNEVKNTQTETKQWSMLPVIGFEFEF